MISRNLRMNGWSAWKFTRCGRAAGRGQNDTRGPGRNGNRSHPVGPNGKPVDAAAYRAELEKLERALSWAAEDGRAQREAYEKVAKKQKERSDLIDATRTAFLFTLWPTNHAAIACSPSTAWSQSNVQTHLAIHGDFFKSPRLSVDR